MKNISSLPLILFYSCSRCFNNSDGDFLIGEERSAVVVFAVIYHKNNDSSNISLPSCSNFLFSVSLFVCLCAQSLSRERSWSPQSLGRWWSSRTRSVSSRWAVCFPFPLFSKKSAVVSAPTSHLPYLERHCLVLFESDLKNKRRWKRGFKLPKAWPPGQQHVCFSKSVQNWNNTQLILNRTKFPLTATFHIFFFFLARDALQCGCVWGNQRLHTRGVWCPFWTAWPWPNRFVWYLWVYISAAYVFVFTFPWNVLTKLLYIYVLEQNVHV